jgi:glycosyltransferase involved in cell wall biosynthesis
LIVDDCSTDNTCSIHQLQFKTTEYVFKLPVNSGTEFSRNTALTQMAITLLSWMQMYGNLINCKFNSVPTSPMYFSFYECINAGGKPLNKREAPTATYI